MILNLLFDATVKSTLVLYFLPYAVITPLDNITSLYKDYLGLYSAWGQDFYDSVFKL